MPQRSVAARMTRAADRVRSPRLHRILWRREGYAFVDCLPRSHSRRGHCVQSGTRRDRIDNTCRISRSSIQSQLRAPAHSYLSASSAGSRPIQSCGLAVTSKEVMYTKIYVCPFAGTLERADARPTGNHQCGLDQALSGHTGLVSQGYCANAQPSSSATG